MFWLDIYLDESAGCSWLVYCLVMVILQAILLGIVEGLTEFLPVSSTGHLIIAEEYINFRDDAKTFTIVIQLGAIAAVIWYYRRELLSKVKGFFQREKAADRFWLNLVIATIPAGILGLMLESKFEQYAQPVVIATALILGGFVLMFVDRKRPVKGKEHVEVDKITRKQAILIGFAQCVALIPGVSRSGATIVGGLLSGTNRVTATSFSFYLGIPVLGVAGLYKLIDGSDQLFTVSGGASSIIIGTIASFVVALMAISWLLRYISTHSFKIFAYYRIILGVLVLIFLA